MSPSTLLRLLLRVFTFLLKSMFICRNKVTSLFSFLEVNHPVTVFLGESLNEFLFQSSNEGLGFFFILLLNFRESLFGLFLHNLINPTSRCKQLVQHLFIKQPMHQNFKSSPAFTFASKTATITSSNLSQTIPGPGQYSPSKQVLLKKIARQAFFAKSKRKQLFGQSNQTPGPGVYHQKLESSLRESRISLRARLTDRKDKTPGPGQYNDYLKSAQIRYSFTRASKNNPFESKSLTPPPCQYESKSSLSDHSIKIGSSSRKRLALNEKDVPGPGAYRSEMDLSSVGMLMNKFSKSKRIRNQKIEGFPGRKDYNYAAGAYETKSMFEYSKGNIPGPTLSSRFQDIVLKRKASLPAPNLYITRTLQKQRAAKYSMAKSSRQELWKVKTRTSSSTDFYDYDKNPDKRIKIKFSKDEKLKPLTSETKRIGPGQYRHAVEEILKLKQTSPNFTISKTKRTILPVPKERIQYPGPAVHNSLLHQKPHAVTLAKSKRPNYTKQGPGPGTYLIKAELRKSLEIKFARSQRTPDKFQRVPGPGAYEIKSRIPNLAQYK